MAQVQTLGSVATGITTNNSLLESFLTSIKATFDAQAAATTAKQQADAASLAAQQALAAQQLTAAQSQAAAMQAIIAQAQAQSTQAAVTPVVNQQDIDGKNWRTLYNKSINAEPIIVNGAIDWAAMQKTYGDPSIAAFDLFVSKYGKQPQTMGYAVGTDYVPYDMTADIHQGEKIIDPQSSAILSRYGIKVQTNGSADNKELVAELKTANAKLSQMERRLANIETKARLAANQ